jgi:hypothetical protein
VNVRLEEWEIKEITKSFTETFGALGHLWLFGSRVYMEKRVGDIDLYLEVDDYDSLNLTKMKSDFWVLLQDRLGKQKNDVVIKSPTDDLLIYKVARQEGVQLV